MSCFRDRSKVDHHPHSLLLWPPTGGPRLVLSAEDRPGHHPGVTVSANNLSRFLRGCELLIDEFDAVLLDPLRQDLYISWTRTPPLPPFFQTLSKSITDSIVVAADLNRQSCIHGSIINETRSASI